MKRSLTRKRLIAAAILTAVLLFFAWALGWGGGPIRVMDFGPEEVDRIELSCSHPWIAEGRSLVTQAEDIQTIIETVNGFRRAGNDIGEFLRQGFSAGGSVLYDVDVYLKNGDEFPFVLCPMSGSDDTRFGYWVYQPGRSGGLGQVCRGSLDWFYSLHEKYASDIPSNSVLPH